MFRSISRADQRLPQRGKVPRRCFVVVADPDVDNRLDGGVNELGVPLPSGHRGAAATSRRSREASFNGADGAVENGTFSKERIPKHFVNPNHF